MDYTIVSKIFSEKAGGIENMAFNIQDKLNSQDQDQVRVFYTKFEGNKKESNKYYRIRSGKFLYTVDLFFKLLKKKKTKIYIALQWPSAIALLILKYIFQINYVVYAHGNDVYYTNMTKFRKYLAEKVLTNAKLVICNSSYTKGLVNYFIEGNSVVIHPGINFTDNDFDYRKTQTIFSLGRLDERKGFQYVIKSIKILKENGRKFRYIIAGDGPYRKELELLIENEKLNDSCILLGKIDEDEKAHYFSQCDIFIMTSYEITKQSNVEGFGIVYLEANSYGKYNIANLSGGVNDSVIHNKTGTLISKLSPEVISDEILRFYSEHDNRKTKTACINWAKLHDWQKIINKTKLEIQKHQ